MKRIIDIPDNEYRHIKEYYEKNDIVEATYSYIYHGTPLDDVFDKIRAEIDRQQKWLLQAGYTAYNVDIALDAIKAVVAESEEV